MFHDEAVDSVYVTALLKLILYYISPKCCQFIAKLFTGFSL